MGRKMHVDDFIEFSDTDKYASWFFFLHRLPAVLQFKFKEELDKCKLFCTYQGKRFRVVGASRLGDVWLTPNFESTQYTDRVEISECSDWGKEP
jgi:hypothetical protein